MNIARSLGLARRRFLAIARKELRQLARDPLTAGFVIGMPLVQILLFGYAINEDIRHIPTLVVDSDRTHLSRELLGELVATQAMTVVGEAATLFEAERAMREGLARAAIVIPEDFSRSTYRGHDARVLILVDATDPVEARAVEAAAKGLESSLGARLEARILSAGLGAAGVETDLSAQPSRVTIAVHPSFNPELRSALFSVPALIGVILTTTMIMLTALSIVRERERGTFELLIATPIRRLELMAGKIAPYIAIGLVQIALTLVVGLLLFRVPIRGSLVDLAAASMVFIAANLALGLVISAIAMTQLQATQMSFFVFLPSVLLSGFMFPFAAMPAPARFLGELLPLTHFVRITRGILLRGAPLDSFLGDLGALLLFFAVTLAASAKLFKKQLG